MTERRRRNFLVRSVCGWMVGWERRTSECPKDDSARNRARKKGQRRRNGTSIGGKSTVTKVEIGGGEERRSSTNIDISD